MDNNVNYGAQSEPASRPKRRYVYGKGMPLYFFVLIFSAIAIVMQSITVLFGYDPVMQVYKHGNVLGTVSAVIIFLFVLVYSGMALVVVGNLKRLNSLPPSSSVNAFVSAAAGVFMAVTSLMTYIETRGVGGTVGTVSVFMLLLSIPAAAYFILSSLKNENKNLLCIFGFFPVLWAIFCLLRVYFEKGAAINDPVRVLFQISFAAVMLTLLLELRTRLGKKGTPAYVIMSGVSVIIGLPSVISMLLLFIIPRTLTVAELFLSITQLLLCLHVLIRLHTNLKNI